MSGFDRALTGTCRNVHTARVGRNRTIRSRQGMRRMATATVTGVRAADGSRRPRPRPVPAPRHAGPRSLLAWPRGDGRRRASSASSCRSPCSAGREGETAAARRRPRDPGRRDDRRVRLPDHPGHADARGARHRGAGPTTGAASRVASPATTIAAGELVTTPHACDRRAAPHGLRAMSIPIDPSRAVGGRLARRRSRRRAVRRRAGGARSSSPTHRCSPSTRGVGAASVSRRARSP